MGAQIYKTDALIAEDIVAYLDRHQHKTMLRFITCGSVDDGKSTLIGRLLYDTKMIFEDQLASLERDSKTVRITSPLKWVVNYRDYGLDELKRVLADRNRTEEQLKRFVLHFLLVEHVFTRQAGIREMLDALRFPVVVERRPEFGNLPITCVTTAVSTYRPDDEVIIETTEISGSEEFEEFVKVSDVSGMKDALREKLMELVRTQGPELLEEA